MPVVWSTMPRVVLRWNCAKFIANIDDLAISIWAPKVIDERSQIDDISSSMPGQRIVDIGPKHRRCIVDIMAIIPRDMLIVIGYIWYVAYNSSSLQLY